MLYAHSFFDEEKIKIGRTFETISNIHVLSTKKFLEIFHTMMVFEKYRGMQSILLIENGHFRLLFIFAEFCRFLPTLSIFAHFAR